MFLALLLVVRGLPALFIYRRVLSLRKRAEMALLIALPEIGLSAAC